MESRLDFLQNKEVIIKSILDKISFYSRILHLKETHPYEIDGIFAGKMYDLQSCEKKIMLISKFLNDMNIKFKIAKRERLFLIGRNVDDFYVVLSIEYDETAVGGAFGIYEGKNDSEGLFIWGGMFEMILVNLYNYDNKFYRFCTIDEDEVKDITSQILQLFNDFADEFRLHTSKFIV